MPFRRHVTGWLRRLLQGRKTTSPLLFTVLESYKISIKTGFDNHPFRLLGQPIFPCWYLRRDVLLQHTFTPGREIERGITLGALHPLCASDRKHSSTPCWRRTAGIILCDTPSGDFSDAKQNKMRSAFASVVLGQKCARLVISLRASSNSPTMPPSPSPSLGAPPLASPRGAQRRSGPCGAAVVAAASGRRPGLTEEPEWNQRPGTGSWSGHRRAHPPPPTAHGASGSRPRRPGFDPLVPARARCCCHRCCRRRSRRCCSRRGD